MSTPLVTWDCVALGGAARSTSHLSKVQHRASAAGDLQGDLRLCSCAGACSCKDHKMRPSSSAQSFFFKLGNCAPAKS